jgi:hypothetical protein
MRDGLNCGAVSARQSRKNSVPRGHHHQPGPWVPPHTEPARPGGQWRKKRSAHRQARSAKRHADNHGRKGVGRLPRLMWGADRYRCRRVRAGSSLRLLVAGSARSVHTWHVALEYGISAQTGAVRGHGWGELPESSAQLWFFHPRNEQLERPSPGFPLGPAAPSRLGPHHSSASAARRRKTSPGRCCCGTLKGRELKDVSAAGQPVEKYPQGGGRALRRGQLPDRHTRP